MLAIPTKGFGKSVSVHRIKPGVFADWIEGSVLLQEDTNIISQIDVADTLLDDERYSNQDFALAGVKDAWTELRRRERAMGTCSAFSIEKKRISRHNNWRNYPAYTFCILLSLAPYYDWWKETEYPEQGEIFELLTKESFSAQFAEWEVFHTGWTKNKPVHLREVATEVINHLGEIPGDMATWDDPYQKEAGLDLLCYRPFSDRRQGIPVYLMQCASGDNWKEKLHTPDLGIWTDIIQFKNHPLKAFSTPFTFDEKIHAQNSKLVGGLFLERCRLLSACNDKGEWLSEELRDRIISWSEKRIDNLLEASQL
jgi:hypothetical protein